MSIHGDQLRNTTIPLTKLAQAAQDTISGKLDANKLGAVNGAAQLDGAGKLLVSQVPDSLVGALKYMGTWNAATNIPEMGVNMLAAGEINRGHYYKVGVAGTTGVNGISDWGGGDWIVSNGTTWEKVDNSELPHTAAGASYSTANAANLDPAQTVQEAIDLLAAMANAAGQNKFVNELAIGVVDGVNTVFESSFVMVVGTLGTYRNGILQELTDEYTVDYQNELITFVTPPQVTDKVRLHYFKV